MNTTGTRRDSLYAEIQGEFVKIRWPKHGFFRLLHRPEEKKNYIRKLHDQNGNAVEGMAALGSNIQNYFSNLFTSKVQHVDPYILERVQTKLTDHMNNMLMAPYTHDDVRKAVFCIGDLKL